MVVDIGEFNIKNYLFYAKFVNLCVLKVMIEVGFLSVFFFLRDRR